jgi:hypothetical protein
LAAIRQRNAAGDPSALTPAAKRRFVIQLSADPEVADTGILGPDAAAAVRAELVAARAELVTARAALEAAHAADADSEGDDADDGAGGDSDGPAEGVALGGEGGGPDDGGGARVRALKAAHAMSMIGLRKKFKGRRGVGQAFKESAHEYEDMTREV